MNISCENFLNINDLMLEHDIKLNNKHNFKLTFR